MKTIDLQALTDEELTGRLDRLWRIGRRCCELWEAEDGQSMLRQHRAQHYLSRCVSLSKAYRDCVAEQGRRNRERAGTPDSERARAIRMSYSPRVSYPFDDA